MTPFTTAIAKRYKDFDVAVWRAGVLQVQSSAASLPNAAAGARPSGESCDGFWDHYSIRAGPAWGTEEEAKKKRAWAKERERRDRRLFERRKRRQETPSISSSGKIESGCDSWGLRSTSSGSETDSRGSARSRSSSQRARSKRTRRRHLSGHRRGEFPDLYNPTMWKNVGAQRRFPSGTDTGPI